LSDALANLGDTKLCQRSHSASIPLATERRQLTDVIEGETKLLAAFDEAQAIEVGLAVLAEPALDSFRLRQQPTPLVVADRLYANADGVGELANGESVRWHSWSKQDSNSVYEHGIY